MSTKRKITYPCPYCGKRFLRDKLVIHIDDNHEDEIPKDFTATRLVYHIVNKRPYNYHGKCTECKGPTPWDENKGRYDRQCGKKSCHDSYVAKFEANMRRTRGVTRISQTDEGQRKMLANRRISGEYRWSDGTIKTYTGRYEKDALEFMDQVMNLKSTDLIVPGPTLEYTLDGETHMYIPDMYYQPYDLIIEVKDGGSNPNNRNMPEYRKKQIAKEEHIIKNTTYNYIRLTDNDLSQLLKVFLDLKMQFVDTSMDRVVHVNEAMAALSMCGVVGLKDPNAEPIMVQYMQNNAFNPGFSPRSTLGLSRHGLGLDTIFHYENGQLTESTHEDMMKQYDSYKAYAIKNRTWKDIDEAVNNPQFDASNIYSIYEAFTGHPLMMEDPKWQLMCDTNIEEAIDFYTYNNIFSNILENYYLGANKDVEFPVLESVEEDYDIEWAYNMESGNYIMRLKSIPELFYESKELCKVGSAPYQVLKGLLYHG